MTKKFTGPGSNVKDEPILKGLTPKSTSYTFSYPKGLLLSTQFSQPALILMEMVEYERLKAKGVVQSGAQFAGHSLGEYAALGACTTFMSFENLLTLVFYRGLKMQNALQRDVQGRTDYSMVATDPSRVGKGNSNWFFTERIWLIKIPGFDERSFQNVVTLINQETKLLLEVVNHNVKSQQYVCAGHVSLITVPHVFSLILTTKYSFARYGS
jgi:fatty acid synthase subunit beta